MMPSMHRESGEHDEGGRVDIAAARSRRCIPRRALLPALAAAALLVACASPLPSGPQARLSVTVEQVDALKRYQLGYAVQPGDVLEIFVYRHQELSRKVVVRPDGKVSLPLMGDVVAAGQSPAELAKQLTARLAQRLREPEVTVIVENPPEPMVYVVGSVGTPRAVPLRTARTLAQALAQSGDLGRSAAVDAISVLRLSNEGVLEMHLARIDTDTARAVSQTERYMAMNVMTLQANDLVVVPESVRSQLMRGFVDFNTVLSPFLNLWILREVTQ